MKGKSKASKTDLDKDSTMSSSSSETTLLDKLNSCENNIQKPKSSKTSALDSISKGKDCKPYWSDLCAQISSKLLLPVEKGCADSDLNYSSSWSNKTVEKSWFSQTLYTVKKPNLQRIFSPSFMATVVECTVSEVTARKSSKIRIFLNADQKALLKRWFGVSRFVFNKTIKYLQEPGTKANWLAIKTGILNSLPNWAASTHIPHPNCHMELIVMRYIENQ